MNFIEEYPIIVDFLQRANYKSRYVGGDRPYEASNLNELRNLVYSIEKVPFIESEIASILDSWLFLSSSDLIRIESAEENKLSSLVSLIRIKLSVLKEIVQKAGFVGREDLLYVKFPDLNSFERFNEVFK